MIVAAVVVTPLAGWATVPAIDDPVALGAGVGVGICSSVIPYVSDQLAMAKLTRSGYAVMVALLPATATVIGLLVLQQKPSAVEVAGVALVVAGVALRREPVPATAAS
jgi:inner membrane transporter RhtA